jgi:hypothetical protein
MKIRLCFSIAVISGLLFGCNFIKSSEQNRIDLRGTTWVMHLKGDAYNYLWLSCDSTYIAYDYEIENRYYGKFKINNDTLILIERFEDDYHRFGLYPIKRKSFSMKKYLILNDSIIESVSVNLYNSKNVYSLKQHFDCKSFYD